MFRGKWKIHLKWKPLLGARYIIIIIINTHSFQFGKGLHILREKQTPKPFRQYNNNTGKSNLFNWNKNTGLDRDSSFQMHKVYTVNTHVFGNPSQKFAWREREKDFHKKANLISSHHRRHNLFSFLLQKHATSWIQKFASFMFPRLMFHCWISSAFISIVEFLGVFPNNVCAYASVLRIPYAFLQLCTNKHMENHGLHSHNFQYK